jgi:hypothetical protein
MGLERRVRIEIILPPTVPWHLRETLARCGFEVVRIGSGFRIKVRTVILEARGITVRIEPDGPKTTGAQEPVTEDG